MDDSVRIIQLLSDDATRMRALRVVAPLDLPDWLIAAGFIRNANWDQHFQTKTPLTDIDVIYYCKNNLSPQRDKKFEAYLQSIEPSLRWSVKNQARMHLKNGDAPYRDTLDAMSFWPEKQTCIGVRIAENGHLTLHHCFPLSLQFSGGIERNPKRSNEIFNKRIETKGWLKVWPQLKVDN